MGTAEYNRVFVLGTEEEGNREVVHVPAGEDTDLPATSEFYYTSATARFPYLAP
jgi:hypothetical protein